MSRSQRDENGRYPTLAPNIFVSFVKFSVMDDVVNNQEEGCCYRNNLPLFIELPQQ